MSSQRGPQIGPTISQIHDALVAGFDGYQLSVVDPKTGKPKFLRASNTVTASISGGVFPFLAIRTGSFSLQPWKDFMYSISWDIPARLTVQGPGEDGEASVRAMLLDIMLRTNELSGLPIDSDGKTVPFGDETLRLFDRDELEFLCDRGAPYIKSVVVQGIDDGLSHADIVFHIETTVNLDPRTLKLMKVGVIGLNPVSEDSLYGDTTAEDGRGVKLLLNTSAETAYGGRATKAPQLPPGFYSSSTLPSSSRESDPQPKEVVTSVNVTPYSASLSAGSPTQSLQAIAFFADSHSAYVTSQASWLSSDVTKATVSSAGVVTRVAAGTATITCTFNGVTSNGVAITCT